MRAVFSSISGKYLLTSGLVLILFAGASLYHFDRAEAADQAAAMPPAPTVEVATLESREIRTWAEFSGRMSAAESAEIKPLVGGVIQQVLFRDGEVVSKGQPLFLIDPRPHEAAVKLAEAQLASARARAKLAKDELVRAERLVHDKLIAASDFDRAASEANVANAAVEEAEAARVRAQLNLEYAHIAAPVSGRISRAELTVGNVVETGSNAPVLASIVSNEKLYAEFNVDEQTYIKFVRGINSDVKMPVQLTLDADQSVVYEGALYAFDNRLDTNSGTIRARAIFENTDGALTPGMYARVRLGAPEKISALLIPERAIGTNQSKKFALVVDENNIATYREIRLGSQWQNHRIITAGLAAGDRVIVNGLSHVRPNTPVNPVPVNKEVATTRF